MEYREDLDELKDVPTLRGIPKVDPFVVPEGFFDRFPHVVQARVVEQKRSGAWFTEWVGRIPATGRLAGAVALVAVIIGSAYFIWKQDAPIGSTQLAELTISPTEIDLLIDDGSDLLAMIDDAPDLMAKAGDGLSEEEMAAYLENEELPLDLLIEEL